MVEQNGAVLFDPVSVKRVRIVSNDLRFGPLPEPTEEVEQHLTIISDGRVWFSGYGFLDGKTHQLRATQSKIHPEITSNQRNPTCLCKQVIARSILRPLRIMSKNVIFKSSK